MSIKDLESRIAKTNKELKAVEKYRKNTRITVEYIKETCQVLGYKFDKLTQGVK